jgi:lysophospholipase L1-like esterase
MMTWQKISALIFVLLLLTGCGGSRHEFDPIPDDGVILSFGDSLTHGTGVKRNESYPSVLQQLTGRMVINAGVPGEVTADGVKRLPALLDKHQPDLLILIHGGNDMLRKKNLELAVDNLRQMIEMSRNRNVPVIMMAVPNPTLILSPAEFYEELAGEMNVPIEVDAISDILQYPSNKSDAVHPNADGYRKMAESLQQLLISIGAL